MTTHQTSKYTVLDRTKCRLCKSDNLKKFMHFDDVPFFDEVVTSDNQGTEFSYPMDLYFCVDCRSVQTLHDVNIKDYYQDYQYVASNSPFMKRYMSKLVDYCHKTFKIANNEKVIEVGAADGYLLSLFKEQGADCLGFEAATNLCDLANTYDVKIMNMLFSAENIPKLPEEFHKVKLFVLLHTFDHLYDPSPFLSAVTKVLDPDNGVLLLEVHDLKDIYEKHETALFGHEHATYLHYDSMERLLLSHGLRIIDFNFLDKEICRGSSMLVAATPVGSKLSPAKDLTQFSMPSLDKLATFERFQDEVMHSFAYLRQYLEQGIANGKRYAGYGGWGRGVTTLAMCKLNSNHLKFVADSNASLHACLTPVTNFEIKGPQDIRKDIIDEVIVFNYAYIDEIRATLKDFIDNGGKVTSVIEIFSKAKCEDFTYAT